MIVYNIIIVKLTIKIVPSKYPTGLEEISKTIETDPRIKIINKKILYREVIESGETTASYDFYYGKIDVTVSGNFGDVSLYCYSHGYMGGKDLLRYSTECSL